MSDDRIGQIISGRYRIDALIGEGGMGAVYLAEHTMMRKRIALKLLHKQWAEHEEVLARFRREAEAAAQVEHPNIVAATDFGQTEDGSLFLVLEYVEGTTLRKHLADAPFPTTRALHIARQVALALERAHDAGIVHRDLKPENVMLVTKGDDPDFVKVLDFGVARIDRPSEGGQQLLTQAGTVMGTPSYMAPEQAVADRVTHRADLYALGCVLYEMLTAKVPFEGDMLELLTAHVTQAVPMMADRAPGVVVPPAVESVVRKLLEKDANDRYPTARALVEAIDQAAVETGLAVPRGAPVSERKILAASAPEVAVAPAPPPAPPKKPDVLQRAMPYAEKAADLVAKGIARAKELVAEAAKNLNVPPIAVVGAVAGALVLVLVLVVVLVGRRGSSTSAPGGSTVAKLLGARTTATPEEIRAAAAKGPAALEELAAKFPADPAVGRELVFAYDAAGRSADAMRVVRTMLDADAGAFPRDLVRVVIRAASKLETADEAFRLLEGPLGADGVDALMELAEDTASPSTAARAQKSLGRPSVRANASPATAFVLDLRAATTCDERHAVLVHSGKEADARALTALRALEVRHGCGKRRRFDCNPCLRKDDALKTALDAAQAADGK